MPKVKISAATRRDWEPEGGHDDGLPLWTVALSNGDTIDIHAETEDEARTAAAELLEVDG